MVSVLVLSAAQSKDYEMGMCCFYPRHAALRDKNKDWLSRNQDNASEYSNKSTPDSCLSELEL